MADEGWRGLRRVDVWPSTDMPCPRRRRSFRHRRHADHSTAVLTPNLSRCHSLASTALTTTLTAALALAVDVDVAVDVAVDVDVHLVAFSAVCPD